VDDDIIATRGRHEIGFGGQSIISFVHDYDPNTFNGAYVFGGDSSWLIPHRRRDPVSQLNN
jgi:hypothetical protein